MSKFTEELERLINKHSKENDSDTPDFILAKYLVDCLRNLNKATSARENWRETCYTCKVFHGIIGNSSNYDRSKTIV